MRQVLAVSRRPVYVVEGQTGRHSVVDHAFELRRGRPAYKAELSRADGGGGDREQEFAVLGAPRADEQRFRSPEVREREPPEGELLAERMSGQEYRAQQFAGGKDIPVVASHE